MTGVFRHRYFRPERRRHVPSVVPPPSGKYAVRAGGNWSTGSTWSDGIVPTAADDVYLYAGSGNVTIPSTAVCRSLNCAGYRGTLLNQGSLTIGDATAGLGNSALILSSVMTYDSSAGTTFFASTSATQQTITSNGTPFGAVTFSGIGGSWILTDAMTLTGIGGQITQTRGTFATGGFPLSAGAFISGANNARTFSPGSSAITLTGANQPFLVGSSLTVTANTAVVTCTAANTTFTPTSGQDFNGMSLVMSGSGTATLGASCTLGNFTRTGTAVKTDELALAAALTVTGTFTVNGDSTTNRVIVRSSVLGTNRTVTAATVSTSNTDWQDITGAGAASWNLSAITGLSGDALGNAGITFTTAAAQTWQGTSGGSWSDVSKWTSRVPLPQDDVVIASAFTASQTVTTDMPRAGRDIDWTGTTGTSMLWSLGTGTSMYGSLTLTGGAATPVGSSLTLSGRGTHAITSNGRELDASSTIVAAPGGTYSLADDAVLASGALLLRYGTFDTANHALMALSFSAVNGTVGTRQLILGTSTVTLISGTGTIWDIATTSGGSYSMASSTIVNYAPFAAVTFAGGGQTYGTLTDVDAGITSASLTITSSNTFNTINFSDASAARTMQFTSGTTQTITNFNVFGTSGKLMTVKSVTSSSAANLVKAGGGVVDVDYLSVRDIHASPSSTWYAGTHSTNVSGNTGWTFTAAPAVASFAAFGIPI